ncbi:MAG: rhodanese-like domain-containing protein [Pseudomonadota bacterium]
MRKIGRLCIMLVAVAAFLGLTPAWAQNPAWKEILPEALHRMLAQNDDLMLINTMSYIECRDHAIIKSVCIPCETSEKQIDKLPRDKQRKLVYYCESNRCLRSYKSAEKAVKQGHMNVYVLRDGLPGWKKAGFEVVSLERIPRKAIPSVKPSLLKQWMGEGKPLFILDIRSEEVFREEHIDGAVNIPFYRLDSQYQELPLDREILLVDEMGFRSFLASCYLARKGLETKRLFGGMEKWQKLFSDVKRRPAKKQN